MSAPPPTNPGSPPPPIERRQQPRVDPHRCAHHDAIYTLARASELHDQDTGDHVLRIRLIVERIALQMGFDPEEAEALGYDAMLHDVGKLTVPREILQSRSALSDADRLIMQLHTVNGERLLAERPSLQRAAIIARAHHECFDGSGYPEGLAGEAIPIVARITAAADVLDALMSERAYKRAWTYERALAAVVDLAGTQLDPYVVEALRRCNEQCSLSAIYLESPRCAQIEDLPDRRDHDRP